jgi:hypothetical protein
VQLQPEAAADKVSTEYHRDGHGHYILLRGTGPGKGFWLEAFGNHMVAVDPELSVSILVDRKLTPMTYGGDLINEIIARRAKIVVIMGPHLEERDERQHRAIASYFGFKFHAVNNYLTPEEQVLHPVVVPAPPYNPDLTDAIIVDLDGTYADSSHRKPFKATYEEIQADSPILHVAYAVQLYHHHGNSVIFVTGRGHNDTEILATKDWLKENSVVGDDFIFYSRQPEDNRSDQVVKMEIYDKHIRNNFNVVLVLDDRPRVVRMWHELGLPVLANQAYIRGEF